ncbi:MAG: hypothetical protein HY221_00260 [Candidatus Sungbacteria bacterium]|uniref:Uncharacterized protein n=1 Tax=Candidatus Sungiibacteriota bacterium TaxID=2750080 RepID=A0A932VPD7_9BACT|nr:hypothetical protein [Candidatus Sungbacteria bacterium]
MTTATRVRKLNREIGVLQKDIREIKKVVFAPVLDPEGEYRPSFVRKILAREKEPAAYRFTTKEDFSRQLHGRKK